MMGFKKVYRVLQDLFPEVDSRVLRAVAIEHSKDPDAAAEVVLTEVIPFLREKTGPVISSNDRRTTGRSSEGNAGTENVRGLNEEQVGSSSSGRSSSFDDANSVDHEPTRDVNNGRQLCKDGGFEDLCSLENLPDSSMKPDTLVPSQVTSALLSLRIDASDPGESSRSLESVLNEKCEGRMDDVHCDENCHLRNSSCFDGSLEKHDGSFNHNHGSDEKNRHEKLNTDDDGLEVVNSDDQLAQTNIRALVMSPREVNFQLGAAPGMRDPVSMELQKSGSIYAVSRRESPSEMVTVVSEPAPALNSMGTRSGQTLSIDLLEQIIADARSNKV